MYLSEPLNDINDFHASGRDELKQILWRSEQTFLTCNHSELKLTNWPQSIHLPLDYLNEVAHWTSFGTGLGVMVFLEVLRLKACLRHLQTYVGIVVNT